MDKIYVTKIRTHGDEDHLKVYVGSTTLAANFLKDTYNFIVANSRYGDELDEIGIDGYKARLEEYGWKEGDTFIPVELEDEYMVIYDYVVLPDLEIDSVFGNL